MTAYLLAGTALLLTFVLYGFAHAPAPRHGPDAAGLELFYLMVCPVRWLVVAALLIVVVRRGGFSWISPRTAVAGAAVLTVHATAGVLSISSFMALRGGDTYARSAVWTFGYAIPVVVVAYALAARPGAVGVPAWARAMAVAVAAVTLAGGVIGGNLLRKQRAEEGRRRADDERASAAEEAQSAAVDQAQLDSTLATLRALSPAEPLVTWLVYVRHPRTEVRDFAARVIAERPDRDRELAAFLSTDDRVLALEYIWLRLPEPPRELALPFLVSLESMPQWTERTLATFDEEHAALVNRACEAIVVLADRFANSGMDFKPPIARLHTFITTKYPSENFRAPALLGGWLTRHP